MGAEAELGSDRETEGLRRFRRRWPKHMLKAVWERHHDLLKNVVSLLATTGITSGMGFAFWTVAARLFTQQEVGYGAAAISAITLLATIGMFGLGTLLIGDLPKRPNKASLISAALLASGLGSLVLALAFITVVPHLTTHFGDISGSPSRAALLCAGVALTAMTLVFDLATIGLLRGGLQLTRNLTFVIVRLVLLFAAAAVIHDVFGGGIALSWVAAIPLSLLPIAIRLRSRGEPLLPKPDFARLRSLGRLAATHNWLNLAIQAPSLLIPVLVASILAPSLNAAFYAAWTIVGVLFVLPAHLSTVLFAVASADLHVVARKLRFTLRMSLLLGLPAMAVLGLGARPILAIFGAGYARAAAVPMQLLVISYLPGLPRFFYIAVFRALGRIAHAARVLTTFAAIEVAAAIVGCVKGGLTGLALALLLVAVAEGLYTAPAVIRAAAGSGRHRQAASQIGADVNSASVNSSRRPPTSPFGVQETAGPSYRDRQLETIGLLLSMSSTGAVGYVPLSTVEVLDPGISERQP
jgi:O-antigen/teichoic acid export membrane protein